jgi:hypothetical protein
MRLWLAAGGFAVVSLSPISPVQADEPVFGFIYTTDLLPKGQKEVEHWMTWRHQKAHGYYDQIENRTELSYGVTDAFQLSGYLNYNWTRAHHNAVDGTTAPPEQFGDFSAGPDEHFNAARFVGVSVEAIYRVLSPYVDPIGLAFYLEPTIGPNFREIEARYRAKELSRRSLDPGSESYLRSRNPRVLAKPREYRDRRELGRRRVLPLRPELVVRVGVPERARNERPGDFRAQQMDQ